MTYNQRGTIYDEIIKEKNKDRYCFLLDIAEAINHAYIGSQADKNGRNSRAFKRWRDGYVSKLNPNMKKTTIWGNIKKTSKRLKI